jgi:uncharacterized cupin superfamily protein
MAEIGYFEGEEEPLAGAPPYQPSGSPQPPALMPFAQRKLHVDTLAWEHWESPKKRFRGFSKELSIALGALRNTPIGLGGHPFDLELQKLLPGESGCPFHSHAAQWEMYLLIEGCATVRAGAASRTLNAGDVVLHPPSEPHHITNGGHGDLVFLLIADNPPVDYWHYPDSDKWGFRSPRKFFRTADADYWDGEE